MTPEARIATAADLLDQILAGDPAERALTNWARRSRFAGSKDRAAIRDHVFDALRCRRSLALVGGGETGRRLMIGQLLMQGQDPDQVFTGHGHAPSQLSDVERAEMQNDPAAVLAAAPRPVACDMQDWVWPFLTKGYQDRAEEIAISLRHRAPVFLRANLRKSSVPQAIVALEKEGISAQPHPLSETAIEVTSGARQIARSRAYATGTVELQDAASQALSAALDLRNGMNVLDYCAGGGGKTLAMAARVTARFTAYDANPARLTDLPERAKRAGIQVAITKEPKGRFDLVLCDVPCSGSGAWRRSPEGKWTLTQSSLHDLNRVQDEILQKAAPLVAEGGVLAYATCSLFDAENHARVDAFTKTVPNWEVQAQHHWTPQDGGDGFYLACLTRRT